MSISIESFNANFLIHIRSIAKPHIDETGIIPADIGFNIVCVPNNRVQFFEYHIMDQNVNTRIGKFLHRRLCKVSSINQKT